jgi:ferritin
MLSDQMLAALNAQINAEYYSSYLYLSMAGHCRAINLEGFANWLRIQADEEMIHAMKIYDFVLQRNGRVALTAIEGPPTTWESPLAVFEATLIHEQYVTSRINKLVDLAISESDHATNTFLQWFVNEQVEEEANADAVLRKLQLMADAPGGLFLLDQELAKRPPAAAGAADAAPAA